MKIAVIPARGGSKRIPRKNIKDFCGKPMIARSIETAIASQCFDQVIVSTDDTEIAKVAQDYGALVPFMRPRELSDDYSSTQDVIVHAIQTMTKLEQKPINHVCCIYATAPFINIQDLIKGLDLVQSDDVDFVFSATSYSFPIQRAIKLLANDYIDMLYPQFFYTRSQDLEEAYHDAGQFYWGSTQAWLSQKPIFGSHSKIVLLPRYRVQDIDTEEDWIRAELMAKFLLSGTE